MSDNKEGVATYSIQTLHEMTGQKISHLKEKAEKLSMLISVHGSDAIRRSDLPFFFEAFFEGSHYNMTYPLPGWLTTCSEPWAHELCSLYESPITRPTSLSPQQGEFLRSIVINTNPSNMVEIGTYLGVSTLWAGGAIKDANSGGRLYSIDLHNDILPYRNGHQTRCIINPYARIEEQIARAELQEHVSLIKGDSKIIGKQWHEYNPEPIDILYIDGDHTIQGCVADFEAFHPYLKDDSLIILHDIFPNNCSWDGPRFLIDNLSQIASPEIFELETMPHNFGMAAIRMNKIKSPRKTGSKAKMS